MLAEVTVSNWPAVVGMGILVVSVCSVLMGKWPWEGIIDRSTHNYYNDEEDEETDD